MQVCMGEWGEREAQEAGVGGGLLSAGFGRGLGTTHPSRSQRRVSAVGPRLWGPCVASQRP